MYGCQYVKAKEVKQAENAELEMKTWKQVAKKWTKVENSQKLQKVQKKKMNRV